MSVETFPYERRVPELTRAYRDAQRILLARIRADLIASRDMGTRSRARHFQAQLQAVLRLLDQLGQETDPLARELVSDAVSQSAERTARQIGTSLQFSREAAFNGVARDAVQALADSMVDRLEQSRAHVGRRVQDVYARAGRRMTLLGLLGADGNRKAVSARMVNELQAQGVKSFTDKAGKQWALETYAEMVARTVTREAVTQGALARMAAHGVNLARVSSHASACKICVPWQGKLVSLDGAESEYRGEPVATLGALPNGGPPFHPNCRHVLTPIVSAVDQTRPELAAAV